MEANLKIGVFISILLLFSSPTFSSTADISQEIKVEASLSYPSFIMNKEKQKTQKKEECAIYILNKTGKAQKYYFALHTFSATRNKNSISIEKVSPAAVTGNLVGSLAAKNGKAAIKFTYPTLGNTDSDQEKSLQCAGTLTFKKADLSVGNIVGKIVLAYFDKSGARKLAKENFIFHSQ